MHLDLARWPRRDTFAHYRSFDQPFFSICTRVDVAPLKRSLRGRGSLALAWHFIALGLCNQIEAFRLRIDGEQVLVLPQVHGSTTVLRDDGSFGFAHLAHASDHGSFVQQASAAIEATRRGLTPFEPAAGGSALIYFTTLRWVHFTSFTHARCAGTNDSVPRFAFGRIDADGERLWMPMAIDVHHALMDGAHVGEFVERFEAALGEPEPWLA